jgi:hypothetical protein
MVASISVNSAVSSAKASAVLVVLVVLAALVHPRRTNHRRSVLAVVLVATMPPSVLVAAQAATNHHRSRAAVVMVVMLAWLLVEALVTAVHRASNHHRCRAHQCTPLMLKDSSKTRTHKSSVARLQVVCKPTLKTFECDSSNHHPSHPRALSSSEKCAHLSHHRHHPFAFANKLLLFQHRPRSSSANDRHSRRLRSLHKRSFAAWPLCQFHRDRSSSSVCHPSHHARVTSSSSAGSHTELRPNAAPLCNALPLLNNMRAHATSSFNMNRCKFVLFVNSNDLVLLKPTQQRTFNNTVHSSLTPLRSFNKLVLLVLSKTSHHLLAQLRLASAPARTAKKGQASKVVLVSLLVVMLASAHRRRTNHRASRRVAVLVASRVASLLEV